MNCRILLYDDGSSAMDLAATLGWAQAHRVASNWAELEQQLDAFSPDVCVLNFSCASIGVADVATIRARSQWRGLPLVGIGSATPEAMRIEAYRDGIDDFLDDPGSSEELQMKLLAWARHHRNSEAGETIRELLEVLLDERISPLASVQRANDVLAAVPAFQENGVLSACLRQVDADADDMLGRLALLDEYLQCRRGKRIVSPMAVSVGAVVLPLLPVWQEGRSNSDVALELVDEGLEHEVQADFQLLRRVLAWLGANACERARSIVRVEVGVGDGEVSVDVADDGDGFDDAHQTQAFAGFQPGNRLNLSSGIGLHLSMARELLRVQHGRIEVVSPGPGNTRVRVSLPAAAASAES